MLTKWLMLATNSSCIFGVNSNITFQMGFSKCKTYNFSGSSLTSQNVIKLHAIFFLNLVEYHHLLAPSYKKYAVRCLILVISSTIRTV